MKRPSKSKIFIGDGQTAATLIEYLIAILVLIITTGITGNYLVNLYKSVNNDSSIDMTFEQSQLIKSRTSSLLYNLQKRVTEQDVAQQCTMPNFYEDFTKVVQNFELGNVSIYYGNFNDIRYLKGFPKEFAKSYENLASWSEKNYEKNAKAKYIQDAWKRCKKQSISRNGFNKTRD